MNFERHVGQLQTRKNANSTDVTPVTAGPQTVGGHERPVRLAHSNVMRLSCDRAIVMRSGGLSNKDRPIGSWAIRKAPIQRELLTAVPTSAIAGALIPVHRWKKDGC
jgi:hypothetical protein